MKRGQNKKWFSLKREEKPMQKMQRKLTGVIADYRGDCFYILNEGIDWMIVSHEWWKKNSLRCRRVVIEQLTRPKKGNEKSPPWKKENTGLIWVMNRDNSPQIPFFEFTRNII